MTQNSPRRIVVVGGGPAAHRFVEAMCSRGTVGTGRFTLTVLTEEAHLPYDRVALSKALTDTGVDLTLGEAALWEQDGVTLVTGARAVDIDLGTREVVTEAGGRFGYDELVLATGSNAATLPIPGNEHTSVYRTLEDVWSINRKVAELTARYGRTINAVTIGGGLLGLEAAAGLQSLGANPVVIDGGKWLMGTQLDEGAGQAMGRLVADKGLAVHGGVFPAAVLTEPDAGGARVTGVEMADGRIIDADMVVVSIGVRPRDELARALNDRAKAEAAAAAGMAPAELGETDFVPVFRMGARGGIVIDDTCATDVAHIWAIGEVANFGGLCVGLVAPANTMAEIVADRLHGGDAVFTGFDTATKLKLSGVDVASFGDAFAKTPGALEIVYADPARGVYQKLVVSGDARTLLGGIFVGDAAPYTSLRPLLGRELPAEPGAYLTAAGGGEAPDTELPDDAILCSCNNVSAGAIRDAVNGCGSCEGQDPVQELGGLKACTRAGTQCGSCVPMLKKLLETELTKSGITVSKALCEHFAMSRAELFEAVRALGLASADEILARFGTPVPALPADGAHGAAGTRAPLGCDICKPVIGSILASQHSAYLLDGGRGTLQDTNDRALANMQKNGTYSVVPRIPGGEITPEKLAVIARVAQKYGLYTKITGALRIDMFGARLEQLPDIWKELVEAGFESGHAYGKALRNVKSCVGSTWCRYGVQDSVAMAIGMELRYRGLRSPHKLKMGVSGCARECAEARGKDVGVIATADGWNLYVGGNGGAAPAHAQLLAKDLDDETLIRYVDRYLMYYIRTADRLQRTAHWLQDLDGGIDHVREVVVDDSLGIAADLEAAMARHVDNYEDEWAATLKDPERLRRFRSFVNAPQEPDSSIVNVSERGMIRPATGDELAAAGTGPVLLGASIPLRSTD
ncbi:nitrite reductase large subunit NirB [Arthrobacter mobilis]|uniref:assimilatory sulfite reductase (ferredoxin) n=1 Tax=Arthrobacter mobilis TaxID=2724944 RepID=A0A7X6HCX1_9MICC|nr:nitrite reductase large subunit NirB [Arthrobacter mobilis]NKX53357.1 FAD-dependent oxidoreductase [Arthrobacter mobilis]